eukprot:scaffold5314_cov167-Amphora_coffeaeformis.AAC.2
MATTSTPLLKDIHCVSNSKIPYGRYKIEQSNRPPQCGEGFSSKPRQRTPWRSNPYFLYLLRVYAANFVPVSNSSPASNGNQRLFSVVLVFLCSSPIAYSCRASAITVDVRD